MCVHHARVRCEPRGHAVSTRREKERIEEEECGAAGDRAQSAIRSSVQRHAPAAPRPPPGPLTRRPRPRGRVSLPPPPTHRASHRPSAASPPPAPRRRRLARRAAGRPGVSAACALAGRLDVPLNGCTRTQLVPASALPGRPARGVRCSSSSSSGGCEAAFFLASGAPAWRHAGVIAGHAGTICGTRRRTHKAHKIHPASNLPPRSLYKASKSIQPSTQIGTFRRRKPGLYSKSTHVV